MTTIILTIHLFLALALVIAVLLQRSEGGALGIGGGGGGGGFMTGRAQANLLTRATAVLAAAFMATSLTLAILASQDRTPRSVLDQAVTPVPSAPVAPARPAVPLGR
ncbi:MAG: preprotein translocase subunit SecG [Alphaproteobacteria bacterium]|nr:preprotein translocase subunit SecG [Alphaproteobacteria bacterium]MCZ6609864.1 preprotein translocase subunit SecG [Alphaproteobacteria bacterium]MCZ6740822.1 preprotein translocase subunit SecG [Alphaproteobacteria bacterium]MCZ6814797.1 preprotein translocase subunit SecG [Alphaproteobacteria bacterium]MCZ6849838.1 preprotein translocase subunit SecG [Alphaproteobacteria bacterium]